MRFRGKIVPAVLSITALAACGIANEVTGIRPRSISADSPRFEYVDSATYYQNYSSILPGMTAVTTAAFYNSNTFYKSTGVLHWSGITDLHYGATVKVLARNGNTLAETSGSIDQSAILPVMTGDSTLVVSTSTNGRTCGILGKTAVSGLAAVHILINSSLTLLWSNSGYYSPDDILLPDCPPPSARPILSFGGASGSTLDLTLPEGGAAAVGLSGTQSTKTDPGASDISGYAWTINGANAGSASSFTHTFSSSGSVGLTVQDQDGATGSGAGSVNISFVSLCDDPLTEIVESCTDNPPSGSVSVDCSGSEPATWFQSSGSGSTYVCYVTDWYQWNGSSWYYTDTTVDYCTFE